MPGEHPHRNRDSFPAPHSAASDPAAGPVGPAPEPRPLVVRQGARERAAQLRLARTPPQHEPADGAAASASSRNDEHAARIVELCDRCERTLKDFDRRAATLIEATAVAMRRAQDAARRAEARLEAIDAAVKPVLATAIREIREAAAGIREAVTPAAAAGTDAEPPVTAGRGAPVRAALAVPLIVGLVLLVGYGAYLHRRAAAAEGAAIEAGRVAEEARRLAGEWIAEHTRRTDEAVADALALGRHAARTMEIMAAPDARRFALAGRREAPGAAGQAIFSRTHGVVITATGIPPAPAGSAYQAWIVTSAGPRSLGLVSVDAERRIGVTFDPPRDLATAVVGFLLTREPAGGSATPGGVALSN